MSALSRLLTGGLLTAACFSEIAFAQSVGPQTNAAKRCGELASELGITVDSLADGDTYVQVPVGPTHRPKKPGQRLTWQRLTQLSDLGMQSPVNGLYVVRDQTGQPRIGVVVIKTGRFGPLPTSSVDRVDLVRRENSCGARGVLDSSVSGEVYDGFHDFGRQDYDQDSLGKLHSFHVAFGKDCKRRTDDDPGGFFRHVSNRASFSFTPDVVDVGGYSPFEAASANFGFGRAARAQSARTSEVSKGIGFSNRRAEIRPYETDVGMACLPVQIKYTDGESFFRTNDLAAPIVNGRRENRH